MIHKKTPFNYKNERMHHVMQYDKDVYFYVDDAYLDQSYPVHFCIGRSMDDALVVDTAEITEDGKFKVKIPNVLLEEPHSIIAYIYVDFDGGQRSIFSIELCVLPRPRPADYTEPDNEDYLSLIQLKNEMLERLQEAADIIRAELEEDAESGRFDGRSPYIGEDKYWYSWDAELREYVNTGYSVDIDDAVIQGVVKDYIDNNPIDLEGYATEEYVDNAIDNIRPELFASIEEASEYAQTSENAYVGQSVTVIDEENGTATVYVIANSRMELEPVGQSVSITSYNDLNDKPTLNGVVIQGELTSSDLLLDIKSLTNDDIENILT